MTVETLFYSSLTIAAVAWIAWHGWMLFLTAKKRDANPHVDAFTQAWRIATAPHVEIKEDGRRVARFRRRLMESASIGPDGGAQMKRAALEWAKRKARIGASRERERLTMAEIKENIAVRIVARRSLKDVLDDVVKDVNAETSGEYGTKLPSGRVPGLFDLLWARSDSHAVRSAFRDGVRSAAFALQRMIDAGTLASSPTATTPRTNAALESVLLARTSPQDDVEPASRALEQAVKPIEAMSRRFAGKAAIELTPDMVQAFTSAVYHLREAVDGRRRAEARKVASDVLRALREDGVDVR